MVDRARVRERAVSCLIAAGILRCSMNTFLCNVAEQTPRIAQLPDKSCPAEAS